MSKFIILFAVVTCLAQAYLQLQILRVPHESKVMPYPKINCSKYVPQEEDYPEVCYRKDINYAVELYHNNEVYVMALDLTAPISWVKNPAECRLSDNNTQVCWLVDRPIKQKIKEKVRNIKRNIKDKVDNMIGKKNSTQQALDDAKTSVGAVQKVSGILQKSENVEFWSKDSNKLVNPFKLLLIGLFLTDQHQKIMLNNTNFINATSLPAHVNSLMDGAISLRFDDESQNSFLNQIFAFVGSPEKYVTIYLGANSSVTLGDLSVKNAEKGYSGIEWFPLDQKRYLLTDVLTIETIGSQKIDQVNTNADAFFTLSASYLGLPMSILKQLIKTLDPIAKCDVSGPEEYLVCTVKNQKVFDKKRFIFEIGESRISFEMEHLKLATGKNKSVTLNIRNSESEYIIFGEPLFRNNFVLLDYAKNRIGLAERKVTFEELLFSIVTLVRFLTFTFFGGITFIIFFKPCMNFVETIKLYQGKKNAPLSPQDRASLRYSNVQQNPYEDLADKMRDALSDPVQGI